MDTILRRGFQLDDRQIFPLEGKIQGPHGSGHVPPKAMDVLLCLALRQGDVVERKKIKKQVWGDVEVNDDLLARYISLLRQHLVDDPNHPKFIRTVHKRGYQLLVPIHAAGAPNNPPREESPDHDRSSISVLIDDLRRRRVFRVVGAYAIAVWVALQVAATVLPPLGAPDWVMALAIWTAAIGFPVVAFLSWTFQVTEQGIVPQDSLSPASGRFLHLPGRVIDFAIIAVLSMIVVYLVYERIADTRHPTVIMTEQGEIALPELTPDVVDPNSIAVLPFTNLSADSRVEYLAVSLAEEVLNLLKNIRELKIPSRDSSFEFHAKDIDLASIARQLRVRSILGGTLDGQVGDLEISAKLTEANSGLSVWSRSFTRRDGDLLSIRDEIARAVVDSLQVALSIESQNRIMRRPTSSADAYDFYLQALGYLRRPRSEQTLDNAEALFRRALDLDPDYALAYAGLCNVYLGKYRLDRRTDHVEPAKRACENALAIAPDLADVHVALGSLLRHTGEYDLAELAFQRAIVLNPKIEPAFYGIGRVYVAQNRHKEAEAIFQYAVDLEPGYWGTHLALGNYYLNYGSPANAIDLFIRVTELNPDYAMAYNNLGAAYYNTGDIENSEKAYLKSIELEPTEFALSNLGTMYYDNGRFDSAADMYRLAIEITPHDFRLWGRLAFTDRFRPGLEDEALGSFRTAIELAEDNLAVNPNDSKTLAYVAAYYANAGDDDKAQAAIQRALEMAPEDPDVHYFAAHVESMRGDTPRTLESLEKAAALGYSLTAIANDPVFEELRTHDRFQAFLK